MRYARSILYLSMTSFFTDPAAVFSVLISNFFSMCPPLNGRDQVSHPYKTAGKIIYSFVYFNLYVFTYKTRRGKYFELNASVICMFLFFIPYVKCHKMSQTPRDTQILRRHWKVDGQMNGVQTWRSLCCAEEYRS
jgi:hypothetical protein